MMKTKVLKGFAALLVLLVVCFFFSGTIRTLTTAKVMLTTPQKGRLTETILLTGKLHFSETEDMTLVLPGGAELTVIKVNVVPGMAVKTGDVLFETQFSSISALIAEQEQNYTSAQTEWIVLEREHNSFRLQRTDETWLTAYDALVAAYARQHDAEVALSVATNLQSGVDEAQAELYAAKSDVDTALSAMEKADRIGIAEEAYNYTMKRRNLEAQMKAATDEIIHLKTLEQSTRQVLAPHDGYIVSVNVAVGQSWDGVAPALCMSEENAEMILMADTSNTTRSISVGAKVTVSGRFSSSVDTTVTDVGYDNHGNPCIQVKMLQNEVISLDTIAYLMDKGAAMNIKYTASQAEYLLPASAVRGSRDRRSVFTVAENRNAFGQTILTIEEQAVTVIDEAGDSVAVDGIYDNVSVAYMEDRTIAPGSEVMAYE